MDLENRGSILTCHTEDLGSISSKGIDLAGFYSFKSIFRTIFLKNEKSIFLKKN